MWSALAVLVVLAHGAYLVFQMLGGLLALKDARWLWLHLAAVVWGLAVVAMRWHCPLTQLEKACASRSGTTPYSGSFLNHYLFGRLLPDGTQSVAFTLHFVVIVTIYVLLGRRWWGPGGGRLAHS